MAIKLSFNKPARDRFLDKDKTTHLELKLSGNRVLFRPTRGKGQDMLPIALKERGGCEVVVTADNFSEIDRLEEMVKNPDGPFFIVDYASADEKWATVTPHPVRDAPSKFKPQARVWSMKEHLRKDGRIVQPKKAADRAEEAAAIAARSAASPVEFTADLLQGPFREALREAYELDANSRNKVGRASNVVMRARALIAAFEEMAREVVEPEFAELQPEPPVRAPEPRVLEPRAPARAARPAPAPVPEVDYPPMPQAYPAMQHPEAAYAGYPGYPPPPAYPGFGMPHMMAPTAPVYHPETGKYYNPVTGRFLPDTMQPGFTPLPAEEIEYAAPAAIAQTVVAPAAPVRAAPAPEPVKPSAKAPEPVKPSEPAPRAAQPKATDHLTRAVAPTPLHPKDDPNFDDRSVEAQRERWGLTGGGDKSRGTLRPRSLPRTLERGVEVEYRRSKLPAAKG